MVTADDVIKVLESDFSERVREEAVIFQEDLQFLNKLKDGIKHKEDGHTEMPLPFKRDKPDLPNNMPCYLRAVSANGEVVS